MEISFSKDLNTKSLMHIKSNHIAKEKASDKDIKKTIKNEMEKE